MVVETYNKQYDRKKVEPSLADKVLELQLDVLHNKQADPNDEKEVEQRRAHNGPRAHICVQNAHPHSGTEDVRKVAPDAHEDSPGKVLAQMQDLAEHVQRWHKVHVANQVEPSKHVNHQREVQDKAAVKLPAAVLAITATATATAPVEITVTTTTAAAKVKAGVLV